ncbi:hypothetical protein C0585_07990 [Candidatus Woesearchaeota archaeon]|nr:MAG: hypothetical protein C0585_07990 [Candidatus Woesearchaeota archaeon]
MKMRKAIKKVVALTAGVTMLGATLMGATAANLADYPEPFVMDGKIGDTVVVVGTNAATSDVVGAIDIAASLQAAATSETSVSATGTGVTVTGGEDYDDLPLNTAWPAADLSLKETKLDGFVDSSFDFEDADIDYHDEVEIALGSMMPATSLTEEDFDGDVYVTVDEDAITYRVYFDDGFDRSYVGDGTHDDDIQFKFLGKTLKVTSFPADDAMNVEASKEFYMAEGDSVTVDNRLVTLKRVGDGAVLVEVDGQIKTLNSIGTEVKFDDADDFEVELKSYFYIDGATDNSATLKLGAEITESAESGKSAEMFGQSSDEDEADFWWDIDMSTSGSQYVGLIQKITRDDLDVVDAEDRAALAIGEAITFPNDYVSVEFAGLETSNYQTLEITVNDDISKLNDGEGNITTDANGIVFEMDGDYLVVGTEETSKVWFVADGTTGNDGIWYQDGDDEIYASTATDFKIKIDSEEITVTPPAAADATPTLGTNTTGYIMDFPNGEQVVFYADSNNDYFGAADDEEADELTVDGTSISTKDYTYVTDYGMVVSVPEDQFGSGSSFELSIPSEQQKATIVVKSQGTSVVGSSGGDVTTEQVNPIGVGLGVLDTDVTVGSRNMIVVGGPCANIVAKELMGNPVDCAEGFEAGKAMIKLYEQGGKTAMLVAGYSAVDTQGATRVVSQYESYDLSGSEASLVVVSKDSVRIE